MGNHSLVGMIMCIFHPLQVDILLHFLLLHAEDIFGLNQLSVRLLVQQCRTLDHKTDSWKPTVACQNVYVFG